MANEERTPVSQEAAQPKKRGAFVRFWDTVLGPYEDRLQQRKYDVLRTEIEGFVAATDPELLTQNISTCAEMMIQRAPNRELDSFLKQVAPTDIARQVVLHGAVMEVQRHSIENLRDSMSGLQKSQAQHHLEADPGVALVTSDIDGILGDLDKNQSEASDMMMSLVESIRNEMTKILQSE
jgi:hypothetical protein